MHSHGKVLSLLSEENDLNGIKVTQGSVIGIGGEEREYDDDMSEALREVCLCVCVCLSACMYAYVTHACGHG